MPELILAERAVTACAVKYGTTEVVLAAGKHLTIETSPAGEEVLDAICPAGKAWVARVNVEIVETTV